MLKWFILLAVVAMTAPGAYADSKVWHFKLVGENTTVFGAKNNIGQQLIFDCEVTHADQKFERFGSCATVHMDAKKGAWMLCSMETYLKGGSVLNQGTFYFKDGVFTGTTAIVGGTGKYVGATGEEELYQTMKTTPPSGNATMRIKF